MSRAWSRLQHPNILRFLGISLDLGLSPALITPLCSSGPVMKYLKTSAKGPIERLRMTICVAEGLNYLHSQAITHGNLCTKRVLIDEHGSPVIYGYGMFKILGASTNSTAISSSPIRFVAPEYFSDDSGKCSARTTAGDVYAFSLVALEILSELEPYHHLPTEHAVFKHILLGGRPIRTHLDREVVTTRIWTFLVALWNQEPHLRPAMSEAIATLTKMYVDRRYVYCHWKTCSHDEKDMEDPNSQPGSVSDCLARLMDSYIS
ncbi:kinase-like domain-containing protein [Mycena galopus ATCC 62051]|nr:kinase-like domain-containing protein [Mycena galopus ATCC 62051]